MQEIVFQRLEETKQDPSAWLSCRSLHDPWISYLLFHPTGMKSVVPKKGIAIPSAWMGPQFTRKSILGASTKYTTMPATAIEEEDEKQAYIYTTRTSETRETLTHIGHASRLLKLVHENNVGKLHIPA